MDSIICDTCKKAIIRDGVPRECVVLLKGKNDTLPIWGPNCSAYTDDPEWDKRVERQVEEYKVTQGLKHIALC